MNFLLAQLSQEPLAKTIPEQSSIKSLLIWGVVFLVVIVMVAVVNWFAKRVATRLLTRWEQRLFSVWKD